MADVSGIAHASNMDPAPVLERKSKFIGQVLRGKLDVREIEDVGETALSYGEINALAAGDPLLLDKAQFDADLTRLRRLERAHDRSQDGLRWQVVSMADQRVGTERNATVLAEVLPRRRSTSADAFTMTVGTAVFDKRANAGRGLQQRPAELARDLGYQREVIAPIGMLAGLPIEAVATRRSSGIELTLRCTDVPYTAVELSVDTLRDDSLAVGLVARLENKINALDQRREELQQEAEHVAAEITRAQARIGSAFPHAGDLSAAKLRAADIEARLIEAATPRRQNSTLSEGHDHSPVAELVDGDVLRLQESDGVDGDRDWDLE